MTGLVASERSGSRGDLPTGTVTFLRTDVEGSMATIRAVGDRWDELNRLHLEILLGAVASNGGTVVRTEGDAVLAAFGEAGAAVAAAIDGQRTLVDHPWPDDAPIRVRMALHTGEAHLAGNDYGGFDINRAARIAAVGHGGQIILSAPTRGLVESTLPDGITIRDLGRHVLRDVVRPEHLFQLDVPGLPTDFPALRTSAAAVGDLPSRLTSFIGRETELADLRALLAERRLVTLTGPGGIGKTSLAIEAARLVAKDFLDGAWLVELADVEDASQVPAAIARVLGLRDGPGRPAADGLAPYLTDRSVLLVLDNFERLLDAAGELVTLLEASRASRILVTSRAPLRIVGEQEYPVPTLGDDCAALFLERARAVRPGWEPGADTAAIDDLCNLLDRLPLGVELAAARVAHLPLGAIRDRLAAHLPLPGSGPRNVPDRQRTLAGAFDWSHDLLSPASQRFLHDLAVFDGGFDLEQVEQVARPIDDGRDALDHLATLADQSLVERDAEDLGGSGIRFRLLATIRGFALERLAEDGADATVRRRHAIAYLALAEAAAPAMTTADQPRWLDRLTIDYANVRAAIRWTIEAEEVELALRFIAAMWRYWQQDGHLVEASELATAALTMPGAAEPTAHRRAALSAAGGIAYWHGGHSEAERWYTEELDVARTIADVGGEGDALWNLAYYRSEDPAGSVALLEQARERFEHVGDERAIARVDWARETLGSGVAPGPDHLPVLEALLERFERSGDVWYGAQTIVSMAWVLFNIGNVAEASRWYVRGLETSLGLRDASGTTIGLNIAAVLALIAERPDDAATLLGASDNLCARYGVKPPLGLQELIGQAAPHERVEAVLGSERYADRFAAGRQLTLEDAVALVATIHQEYWGTDPWA